MKVTNLKDYFERTGYDWENDKEKLSLICNFTKTRIDPSKNAGEMSFGSEQCFLVKSVARDMKAQKFFEIGTGRGTACYSVALEDTIEEIYTIDIVSHFQKKKEAIGYREAIVSNEDLYNMIPYQEKNKISFKHVSELPLLINEFEDEFDLAFIDGNHTDVEIIMNDFNIANKMVKDGGVILFDDYHPTKFAVKQVVDEILEKNPNFDAELICFHGHLFDEDRSSKDNGIVIVKK